MAEVTIDSSGRYVLRRCHDETKSQSETIPVEERSLPVEYVALPELQGGEQCENQDVSEVRGDE